MEFVTPQLSAKSLIGNEGPVQRRLLLRNFQCPGDILMLTAAVRDLHRATGNAFQIGVETSCPQLWDFNPYVSDVRNGPPEYQVINCEYPLIHHSNERPYHFIHGFTQYFEEMLQIRIPVTEFRGDIHFSDQERSWISQVAELGVEGDFWIIVAGGKYDFTTKWWNPANYQKVVNHFRGRITFVQCGEAGHWHPPLDHVVNLVGKTDLRKFLRLIYHSIGIVCPVTFAMHAAVAVPMPPGRVSRACVVVAGGREPAHWEAYPGHRFLSTVGALTCCSQGGCWKSRCQPVYDGDVKDHLDLCENPVPVAKNLCIPRCMDMIQAEDVIRAIESYYEGGALNYNGCR